MGLARTQDMDGETFFEGRVRPVLLDRYVSCHGVEEQEASLRLGSRSGVLKGGDSGPSVVAGNPDVSLLIEAIRRAGLEMPPDEPLDEDEVAVLEEWVRMGAPWPASDTPAAPVLGDQDAIVEVAQHHQAFQLVRKSKVPNAIEAWSRPPDWWIHGLAGRCRSEGESYSRPDG